jgi:hypothetical protein
MEKNMIPKTIRYTLEKVNDLIFQGFDYSLPEETLKKISELALEVGSPDYVKTPVFQKRENVMKDVSNMTSKSNNLRRKKKTSEIVNDDDWNLVRSFQTTKIEEKTGLNAQIDLIRVNLNKLTDKNYMDICNKITEIINNMIDDKDAQDTISNIIFEIASTNRFYSKAYADLYSSLLVKYPIMNDVFLANFNKFMELFNCIEYVDSSIDYDKFCEINKINEKRKSLATFYLNLMMNGVISRNKIQEIIQNLLTQIYEFIRMDNKKNEVDELTENLVILYKPDVFKECENKLTVNGYNIEDLIEIIANSKVKDYKSLSNKTIFKFMDMLESTL